MNVFRQLFLSRELELARRDEKGKTDHHNNTTEDNEIKSQGYDNKYYNDKQRFMPLYTNHCILEVLEAKQRNGDNDNDYQTMTVMTTHRKIE